jgi:hypothetical protein
MRSWMWTDRRGLDRGLALVCALSLCPGGCKVYVCRILSRYVLLITYILSIILNALGLDTRRGLARHQLLCTKDAGYTCIWV